MSIPATPNDFLSSLLLLLGYLGFEGIGLRLATNATNPAGGLPALTEEVQR
jgi:hypothetical protein